MVGLRFGSVLLCVVGTYGCGGGGEGRGPPAANSAPTLSGTPITSVWQDDPYLFIPRALDADSDALAFEIENLPSWATFARATGRLSGTPAAVDVGTHVGIRIGVSDGLSKTWLPPFDLTVNAVSSGSVTVTWEPPTENTDDTPLDNLAAFNVYWGTDPHALPNLVTIVDVVNASYRFDDLPPGTYYFATSAINSFGVESATSDLAVMAVR
jgi:hypothetical protein